MKQFIILTAKTALITIIGTLITICVLIMRDEPIKDPRYPSPHG